jgi:hypothetical protein
VLSAAWRSLIEYVAPDAIVCEHAPMALLASRSFNVHRVVSSTWNMGTISSGMVAIVGRAQTLSFSRCICIPAAVARSAPWRPADMC